MSPPVTARAAFEHRDFRLVMTAKALSVTGGQMQTVAIGWHVYEVTRRPLDLGLVGLAQFLPAAALSLVAGHVADRFDKRRILLGFHFGAVCASLSLFAVARSGTPSIAPIYVIAVALGTLRTFAGPANQSLLPHLVPVEHFPSAVAWSSSIWQIAAIVGPALGGALQGAFGGDPSRAAALVYATSAALSAGALIGVASIGVRTGRSERASASLDTLLAGVRFVFREKLVLGSISLDLFAVLFGGAVALMPIYARDILNAGPVGLGLLRSAPALGAAAMAVFLAHRPIRRRLGPVLYASVAVFGLATIVFGVSRSLWLSLVALFVLGAADMISVVIRQLLVQLATPPSMRGRVSAVNLVFVGASNELGEFESGVTAAWLGVVPAVVLGGAGTLLVVALFAWWFPKLRRLDEVPHPAEDVPAPRIAETG
ncbi:MAG: MFS transporter [Deltaproteobacteria bacterium]|nr:MFS transporter [Deltaproteobacteria bacterium]